MACGFPDLIQAVIDEYVSLATRCSCTDIGSDLPLLQDTMCGDGDGLVREIYAGVKALILRCYSIKDREPYDPGFPPECLDAEYLTDLTYYIYKIGCTAACRIEINNVSSAYPEIESTWFSGGDIFPIGTYKITYKGGGYFRSKSSYTSEDTVYIDHWRPVALNDSQIMRFYVAYTTGGITVRPMSYYACQSWGDGRYTPDLDCPYPDGDQLDYTSRSYPYAQVDDATADWLDTYLFITLTKPGRIGIGARLWRWNGVDEIAPVGSIPGYPALTLEGTPIFELESCLPCEAPAEPYDCNLLRDFPNVSLNWSSDNCATHYEYFVKKLPDPETCEDENNWCDNHVLGEADADIYDEIENDLSDSVIIGTTADIQGSYCIRVNGIIYTADRTTSYNTDASPNEIAIEHNQNRLLTLGCQDCVISKTCPPMPVIQYGYTQHPTNCPVGNFLSFEQGDECWNYFKILHKKVDDCSDCGTITLDETTADGVITTFSTEDVILPLSEGYHCIKITTHNEDLSAEITPFCVDVICCQDTPTLSAGLQPDGATILQSVAWDFNYTNATSATFKVYRPATPSVIVYSQDFELTYSSVSQNQFFYWSPMFLSPGTYFYSICVRNDCLEEVCEEKWFEVYSAPPWVCRDAILTQWTTLEGLPIKDLRPYRYAGTNHSRWSISEAAGRNYYSGTITAGTLNDLPDFLIPPRYTYTGYFTLKVFC